MYDCCVYDLMLAVATEPPMYLQIWNLMWPPSVTWQ